MPSQEAGSSEDAGTSVDGASRAPFDAARPYEKHPQVAIRLESFGALAYHYGNRRLVFLKAPALVTVVQTLGDFPSAAAAVAAHVPDAQREAYTRALSGLLASDVIRAVLTRGDDPPEPPACAPRPRGGTPPTHRPLTGPEDPVR
jgi:mycofactocin biosynthesis protein MftB